MAMSIAERNEARRRRLLEVPVYLPAEKRNIEVPVIDYNVRNNRNGVDTLLNGIWSDIKRRNKRERVFKVRVLRDGDLIMNGKFNYSRQEQYYEQFRRFFLDGGSDWEDFVLQPNDVIQIRFEKKLNPEYIRQRYREGVKHCVIQPIRDLWESCDATSERMIREQKMVLKRLAAYELRVGNEGIPESDFQDLAEQSKTSITVRSVLADNERIFAGKNPTKSIIFENRSLNHLERVPSKKTERTITHDEAVRMIVHTDNILWTGLSDDPTRIITPTEILIVNNPLKPYLEEMRGLLPNVELNATKNPDVNKFIRRATIVNSAPLQLNEGIPTGHLDLESAYTQFHKTSYYKGLPAKIQQKRTFNHPNIDVIKQYPGFYQVRVIESTSFAQMFGFRNKIYNLFSQEILFWADNGVTFHTISGVLCSTFEFTFPASSYEKTTDRLGKTRKPYQMFAGLLSSAKDQHDTKDYCVKGETDFGKHIASEQEAVFHSNDIIKLDGIDHTIPVITIQKPRNTVHTTHHVLAGITSYIRIIMLTEMMKFQPAQLIQVTLDGLFYQGFLPNNLIPELKVKSGTVSESHTPWYFSNIDTYDFPPPSIFTSTAYLGAGGSGKTHQFLSDNGFIDTIYVSPTHELGKEKAKTYNVEYRTFHKQAGIKCTAAPSPSVAFLDEATQLEGYAIQEFIDNNPYTLIVIAGDIDERGNHYQTKYQNKIWRTTLPVKWFTTDYRAKTPLLKNMKLEFRLKMKEMYDQKHASADAMKAWVKQTYPNRIITPYQAQHLKGTRIAGTHKYIDKLNEQFNIQKCKKCDSHYCTSCSIIYTTHAVQGMTIKDTLIIYLDDMFEHTMAYTAMSRAESHEQLYFVSEI
jgi:hypothetical protein